MPPGTQLPGAYLDEEHATHAAPDVQAEPEAHYQEVGAGVQRQGLPCHRAALPSPPPPAHCLQIAEEWAGEEEQAAPEQEEAANAEPAGTRGAEYTAAVATFDAAVHQQYLDLPLWPQTTEEELTVRRAPGRQRGRAGSGDTAGGTGRERRERLLPSSPH